MQIRFPEVPDHANVYFAHPYMLNAGVPALVFPLARDPTDGESGLYISFCADRDLTCWSTPRQLLASKTFEGRTECLPCAGGLWNGTEQTLRLLVHRHVRKRMSTRRGNQAAFECLEWRKYWLSVFLQHGMAKLRADREMLVNSQTGLLALPPGLPPRQPTGQTPAELLLGIPTPPRPAEGRRKEAEDDRNKRLERPLKHAIIRLLNANKPEELKNLPEIWRKNRGHVGLGEVLKRLRVQLSVPVLAPDSVEAAESAAARVAAARVAAADAAEEDPGLTPREAGVSLLEIHAVAHTSNHDIVARGWSDTVKRLENPGSGPFALTLLTHGQESWQAWQAIVRMVPAQTPRRWRKNRKATGT